MVGKLPNKSFLAGIVYYLVDKVASITGNITSITNDIDSISVSSLFSDKPYLFEDTKLTLGSVSSTPTIPAYIKGVYNTRAFKALTAGYGLEIRVGSNCRLGSVSLIGGYASVTNSTITTSTRIFITPVNSDVFSHSVVPSVGSFEIYSSDPLDSSIINYLLIEAL